MLGIDDSIEIFASCLVYSDSLAASLWPARPVVCYLFARQDSAVSQAVDGLCSLWRRCCWCCALGHPPARYFYTYPFALCTRTSKLIDCMYKVKSLHMDITRACANTGTCAYSEWRGRWSHDKSSEMPCGIGQSCARSARHSWVVCTAFMLRHDQQEETREVDGRGERPPVSQV